MLKVIATMVLLLPIINDATGCQILLLDNSVTAINVAEMLRAGWTNNPSDGVEAIYSIAC